MVGYHPEPYKLTTCERGKIMKNKELSDADIVTLAQKNGYPGQWGATDYYNYLEACQLFLDEHGIKK